MSNESNSVLFSVRVPKSIAKRIEQASEELLLTSEKTEADFKRHLLICGLWLIEKEKLKRTNLSPDEFERLHNPRTHSDALAAITSRLENIEKTTGDIKKIIEDKASKPKSWFN